MSWLMLPLAAQGLAMIVDEFYFHYKRGLPLWERLGHPIDTLSVLACFGLAAFTEPTVGHIRLFAGLALLSCIAVTKDEFVHHRLCDAAEQWLHAVLFLLHPACLLVCAYAWIQDPNPALIQTQTGVLTLVLAYQLLYWNLFRTEPRTSS
jgi:hypothetical protein